MSLKEKITADLLGAMKAKDQTKTSALRMLKAAIMKLEVSGSEKKDVSDEQVLTIIGKEVKQRKDSIDAFKKAGRDDLAGKEEAEMKLLQAYLPTQMTEAELMAVVKEVIEKTGAHGKADFGKVMSAVMAQVKGKAEGQAVSKVVGELLK